MPNAMRFCARRSAGTDPATRAKPQSHEDCTQDGGRRSKDQRLRCHLPQSSGVLSTEEAGMLNLCSEERALNPKQYPNSAHFNFIRCAALTYEAFNDILRS
eukprot:scaffold4809_cov116-Isochrysis_galbana.AAC.5